MTDFVHLHVHSEFSLLDGAGKLSELAARAKELGQSALAITDHGCMYGVVGFYKECKKQGVKPIIGMEAYVAPRRLDDKEGRADKEYAHLVLLAKNEQGYRNLSKLSTMGFTRGFYYKPRIDYDVLCENGEGLVVLSACLAGDLPQLLLQGRTNDAMTLAKRLKARFGEDFYIELQDHGIADQKQVLKPLVELARELDIKLVATNDVHYVLKQDAEAQDALMCIQTGKFVEDAERMRMETTEFYLKSADQMESIFAFCPEAISNTVEVAEKCNYDFEFGVLKLPLYEVEGDHMDYLRSLCNRGMERRNLSGDEYKDRLNYELDVIADMGYTDYFLIVWDFIDYAKRQGIMVGPGRGSAAGSLCAYSLGITDIDPLRYNLLFERFLNPERISMPDIDIDFCYERRQEVIDYVIQKYGSDRVAQIITFGTMAARSSIRDIGRVLKIPYGDVDRIAKMIPTVIGITIQKALESNKEFYASYDIDPIVHKVVDLAKKVEGLSRNASTHAAGVVISAKPIVEYVPLQKNNEAITTQFPMGTIEELGLLKMDFLGLRTLTVIRDALDQIEALEGVRPQLEGMEYDDPAVYELISSGQTDGVFQLESAGMRSFLQNLKPDKFEDIIAGISLYRPGPMESIPRYINGKLHPRSVTYETPELEPILNMTYGCMVYQEQVMQIVRDLAGYSLGRSDLVRRAMSKKKADVMAKEREGFVNGCAANGVSGIAANRIFDSMMDFASYAFNKSHAAAYAVVAYQTAWLKAHYPQEFMAALINSFLDSTEKVAEYVYVCKTMGITVLPPDVNSSLAKFSVRLEGGKKVIRFGLGAVKNSGLAACEGIIRTRENGKYLDLYDFCSRCGDYLNKRMLEGFIKAGALDCFGVVRPRLIAVHAQVLDSVTGEKRRNVQGQMSLFELASDAPQIDYPELNDYDPQLKLAFEKEATGLYVSGHPLQSMYGALQALTPARMALEPEEGGLSDGDTVYVGGIISTIKSKLTRKNDKMAYITLEDMSAQLECVAFPNTLTQYADLLKEDSLVQITGRLNTKDEQPNVVIIERVGRLGEEIKRTNSKYGGNGATAPMPQNTANAQKQRMLYLRMNRERFEPEIRSALQSYYGSTPVVLAFEGEKPLKAPPSLNVTPCSALICLLEDMLGFDNVKLA